MNTMNQDILNYCGLLEEHLSEIWQESLHPPIGALKHPFITAGGAQYQHALWDWDSWLSGVALRQARARFGEEPREGVPTLRECERGCILNFLEHTDISGFMPIEIGPDGPAWDIAGNVQVLPRDQMLHTNPHKPCICLHLETILEAQDDPDDLQWIRPHFAKVELFLNFMESHRRHTETGLYFFADDVKIGVDNDPCTFGRPPRSSGSIFLNALLYAEFTAAGRIARRLGRGSAGVFERAAGSLAAAIQKHCWDERDGFYYSVDFALEPTGPQFRHWGFHSGAPRNWPCLMQRIGVWSGVLPLVYGLAEPAQAARVLTELERPETFFSPSGVRSLSAMEPMYQVIATSNPGCWIGPIWNIVNWFSFKAALRYGHERFALEIAARTIRLLGRDLEQLGTFHEYYSPESGEPIITPGFRDWNLLVIEMVQAVKQANGAEPASAR